MAVALVAGVITHISYVLFYPAMEMRRSLGPDILRIESNTPVLLQPAKAANVIGGGKDAVVAVCPFDLEQGSLIVDAAMPTGLWSLTVYGDNGRDLYAVTDRQAGTDRFQLTIKSAPSWLDLLTTGSEPPDINDGWSVELDTRRGFAVFWAALDQREMRNVVAQTLTKSSCRVQQTDG
jgi:uncharacterized membrane protein